MVVALCAILVAGGCARTPPEAALREAVAAMEAAIDARDARAFVRHLDHEFIGPGGMDRDGARRTAALYFLQHTNIGLVPGPLSIDLHDTRAQVSFTAAVTGGNSRLLPERGQVYEVRSGWRLRDDEWRMTSIEWTPKLR
ncbi:nuclear transport factor 2 family protein [Luteimonas yindakuii]|uniref:Nuclear transport factor 2 family protein n=2 Tax=Luteimonas yindakuii TaxID=2565782 RepID=A0A4Z1RIU8_9GAMM|nr:nuclear transport factor 2 family protein [Luteimonas yindakuii]QCO67730.2 nuclear transport factor 2 family protein [Luteimonas yindakuii]TKS54029.1 nuclear transport factor 2 family protein [Luteimonas yindakuii]